MFEAICIVVYVSSTLIMLVFSLIMFVVHFIARLRNGEEITLTADTEIIKESLKSLAFEIFFPVINTWNVFELLYLLIFCPSSFKALFLTDS